MCKTASSWLKCSNLPQIWATWTLSSFPYNPVAPKIAPPTAQEPRQRSWIFLFLLGEVCHSALKTLGSVHPQAAFPCFPASCSKRAEHSSPPFPSLPKRGFCLLWLHGPRTISKKQKQYETMEDARAWPNFACDASRWRSKRSMHNATRWWLVTSV